MELPDKRDAIERFLDLGMVMVHVDARRPGVRVPQAHRGDAQLRLNLSYRFSRHDLVLTEQLVRCTLSFGGRPFFVELPLAAIFAVTSHVTGEALIWPEVLAEALADPERLEPGSPPPAPTGPTLLSSVTRLTELLPEARGERGQEMGGSRPSADEPRLPRRDHLRLVK